MTYIGTISVGSYPDNTKVKLGDLNFWCCTQRNLPSGIASHVGIYMTPTSWIAAQGNMVGIYQETPAWHNNFLRHGSVLRY